jgi:predicted dehydrogenase
MSSSVRVAVAGVGGAGLAQVGYFLSIPGVEVTRLVDQYPDAIPERLREMELPPIPITDRLETVLKDPSIDLVSVCTPDQTHTDLAVSALNAGKHVLVEKPLASTPEQCARLLHAWRRSGKIGAVQHQFRFEPWFHVAAQQVQAGAVGKIFSVHSAYIHRIVERCRRHQPAWRLESVDASPPALLGGIHLIDYFRWLMGCEVVRVSAFANNIAFPEYPEADCVEAILNFENGALGHLTVALGVDQPQFHPLRVYGSAGTLADGYLIHEHSHKRVTESVQLPTRPLSDRLTGAVFKPRRILNYVKQQWRQRGPRLASPDKPPPMATALYDHNLAVLRSLADVVQAVRQGTKPLVTLEDGVRACHVAFAITQSYREGRPVDVPALDFEVQSKSQEDEPVPAYRDRQTVP